MTSQVKRTVEASDIRAVEIECRGCGICTVWPVEAWNNSFTKCPGCGEQWPIASHAAYQAMSQVVKGLSDVAKLKNDERFPFALRFELIEPKDKP